MQAIPAASWSAWSWRSLSAFQCATSHKYADRFVDRVFFRKRHEDEVALRNFALDASFITDRSVLLARSLQTVCRHTDSDNVTIFIRDDAGSYRRYADERVAVSENDPGIIALQARGKPLDLHDATASQLLGAVAFPMIARGTLVGALVCGSKRNGESFAPDEMEALAALAHGVGVALNTLNRETGDSVASLHEAMTGLQASIATMQDGLTAELRGLRRSLRP